MTEFLKNLNPLLQALLAGGFAWVLGGAGAAFIFIKKDFSQKWFDFMLGFAGGIMIAASFWSLLEPAIKMAEGGSIAPWIPAASGFLVGAVFLRLLDIILPHLHLGFPDEDAEGPKTSWHRSILLVLAIAMHNIPEGMAIGVVIGGFASGIPGASGTAVIALVLGMGIHNIPEGMAISVSLRREGMGQGKSFWYGQLSSMVFPFAAFVGTLAVMRVRSMLPYALGFAAGAMIFVVVEEVIPESQQEGNTDQATAGTIVGFLMMMILDLGMT